MECDGELDVGRTVATFRLKEHDVDGRSILRRGRGRFREGGSCALLLRRWVEDVGKRGAQFMC